MGNKKHVQNFGWEASIKSSNSNKDGMIILKRRIIRELYLTSQMGILINVQILLSKSQVSLLVGQQVIRRVSPCCEIQKPEPRAPSVAGVLSNMQQFFDSLRTNLESLEQLPQEEREALLGQQVPSASGTPNLEKIHPSFISSLRPYINIILPSPPRYSHCSLSKRFL